MTGICTLAIFLRALCLNNDRSHGYALSKRLLLAVALFLTFIDAFVLAAKQDLIINNFGLVRDELVDKDNQPILNLLGYKTAVVSEAPAWVSQPVLLFYTGGTASFETYLGSEDQCVDYSGYSGLQIEYRFASGKKSDFKLTVVTCGDTCNNPKSEYCMEGDKVSSFYITHNDSEPYSVRKVNEPDETYDWNRSTLMFDGPQGLGNLELYYIKLHDFSRNVWIEIGEVKLIPNKIDDDDIEQGNVVEKYLPKNDDYIIDDFLDNHRYVTQKNYHGYYTSDDWTNLFPAIAAHGALWLTTKPESYWYTSMAPKGQSFDASEYKYLTFYVRFPFEDPVPFDILIESGIPGARSKFTVSYQSVGTKLDKINTWQFIKVPLGVIPGVNLSALYTISITGFTKTLVVHYGMLKLTKTPDISHKDDVKILPNITMLPDINLKYTDNGSCGIQKNGVNTGLMCNIKTPGIYGSCCSTAGMCGNTVAECGPGCQDGYGMCDGSKKQVSKGGTWKIIGSSGVSAQHAWMEPNTNSITFSDRQQDYEDLSFDGIPYYFAVRVNLDNPEAPLTPISQVTNAFCSGGAWLQNKTMVMVGGHETIEKNPGMLKNGIDGIRMLYHDFNEGPSFIEHDDFKLAGGRWYPTVITLPEDRIFVISGLLSQGRNRDKVNQTWEILNFTDTNKRVIHNMPWLMRSDPYELYPHVYVLPNGRLYIRAGIHNIIFDHTKNTYEDLPDILLPGQNYPKTGSSVMFPLKKENNWKLEIMFCGGSTVVNNNYFDPASPASNHCGIINPMDQNPVVKFIKMPNRRVMGDGLMLPDGKILWINGAQSGSQGYWSADNPIYTPDLYDPATDTWTTLAPSNIERLYHSVAHLLPDGRVLVSGSTPNDPPYPIVGNFANRYEMEIFTPPYLVNVSDSDRPVIQRAPYSIYANGKHFWLKVKNLKTKDPKNIRVVLMNTGFVTHSIHMNERTIELDFSLSDDGIMLVEAPPNIYVGVPGPYMLFVVSNGIPSVASWVSLKP